MRGSPISGGVEIGPLAKERQVSPFRKASAQLRETQYHAAHLARLPCSTRGHYISADEFDCDLAVARAG